MKINLKPLLITTCIMSGSVYATNTTLKSNPNDVKIFETTHSCINCNLVSAGGFTLMSPFENFDNSVLSGSDLSYAHVGNAFSGKSYQWYYSNFDDTIMIETTIILGTAIDYASFKHANLQRAHLTQLNEANYVSFVGSDLRGANLSHSIFHYSDFTNAKMEGANLYEADFCHAIITEEQIKSSKIYACAEKPDCSGKYPYEDGRPCN